MPHGFLQWGEEFFWRRNLELRSDPAPACGPGSSIVQGGFEPCLLTVLRLSTGVEDDDVVSTKRWRKALARTGGLPRAVELACATTSDGLKQGEELIALVNAAADAGDLHGAQALADSIPLRGPQDRAMVDLVAAWARAGERDRAVALAERIRYPHHWGTAWAGLAKALADRGDTEDALRFAARADDEVRSYVFDGTGKVLAVLVEVAAAAGDPVRAAALADRVEDFARSRSRTAANRCPSLAAVLASEALNGDLDRIDALLRPPADRAERGEAGPAGEAGKAGVVEEVMAWMPPSGCFLKAQDLARVLDAVAAADDPDVAFALADRAERLLDSNLGSDLGHDLNLLMISMTRLLARFGQVERAMAVFEVSGPDDRAARQALIVEELAHSGRTDRAEALARAIADDETRSRALIAVVRALAGGGDPDRAEALVPLITDEWAQGEALVAVVRALAGCGETERAEALSHSITHPATRARALVALAEFSEPAQARWLAAQVVLVDGWAAAMPVLERIAPGAVAVIVDQLTG
jgi:tetratricopeptide (TPR) repeat protein